MLYLAISLLYCSNPTPFFSCRNSTIAKLFATTQVHCITFNTLPQRYFTTHYRSTSMLYRRYSEHYFAFALPLSSVHIRCFSRRCCTNTQRLSTMTVLVSSPPRRHYDVHHRNVTALCNTVTRLQHTLPLRHRALPSYATPFHVRTVLSQCFTVFSLTNTELRAAPPYDATTIRFSSALYHGGTPRCIALLCLYFTVFSLTLTTHVLSLRYHGIALRCQTSPSQYYSGLICTIPLRSWFLGLA